MTDGSRGGSGVRIDVLFCVGGGKGRQELLGVVNGNLSRAEVIDMAGDDAVRFRLKRRFMQYRILEVGHGSAHRRSQNTLVHSGDAEDRHQIGDPR